MDIKSNNQTRRIKKLMLAVILRSIVDYTNVKNTNYLYLTAKRWLFSDNLSNDFSFRSLCKNLGYDYKPIRMLAKKLRSVGVKIRQNGPQLVSLNTIGGFLPNAPKR